MTTQSRFDCNFHWGSCACRHCHSKLKHPDASQNRKRQAGQPLLARRRVPCPAPNDIIGARSLANLARKGQFNARDDPCSHGKGSSPEPTRRHGTWKRVDSISIRNGRIHVMGMVWTQKSPSPQLLMTDQVLIFHLLQRPRSTTLPSRALNSLESRQTSTGRLTIDPGCTKCPRSKSPSSHVARVRLGVVAF